MVLVRITRDMLRGRMRGGVATVSFRRRGLVVVSKLAVVKLGIIGGVDVYQGDKPHEFYISAGSTFFVRRTGYGGAVFNSRGLSQMVIEKNWSIMPHNNSGDAPPLHLVFMLCNLPVDDKENRHVYALIRKKV